MRSLFFLIALLTAQVQYAQDIFTRLATENGGDGTVEVFQDDRIRQMLGKTSEANSDGSPRFLTTQGYRIQVFSGNKQRASKDEAFTKETKIKAEFPDQATYVTFNSPFWKLRMGNFRTYEEADDILRSMRKAFPAFAKEMFIVKEEIKIVLN